MCFWFKKKSTHRFFGKGLDINVDVSSVVLIGGRLDVALEIPEGERYDQ